jgi:hypothetical protein
MNISFTEKAAALIFVALCTAGGIFISMRMVVGAMGICK